jgi:1-acyl-sn-glycerol-3-phosphate acyltransferase
MLFPEGTRTHDGNLQKAKPGIGLLVAQSRAPVLPVRIFGMWEAYNRHMKIPRPKKVQVVFGKLISFEDKIEKLKNMDRESAKLVYQEIADGIMEAIANIKLKES